MAKKIQGIYTITNKINGKQYVGQSVNIERRWREHKSRAVRDTETKYYIHEAIEKYGEGNFDFEVVEVVKDKNLLTDRETYWYNKLNPDYNLAHPEPNNVTGFEIDQLNIETLEIVATYADAVRACEATGFKHDANIRKVATGDAMTAYGYYWRYVKDRDTWKPLPRKPKQPQEGQQPKPVARIDLETNEVLQVYSSALEASKEGYNRSQISMTCNGRRPHHRNFKWQFVKNL